MSVFDLEINCKIADWFSWVRNLRMRCHFSTRLSARFQLNKCDHLGAFGEFTKYFHVKEDYCGSELKGGCTIFDVEHMSCSSEFWTRKSKREFSKKFFDRLMAIFLLRIFIATLKMYSLTDWTDRAEIFRIVKGVDLRTVQKISSRSDTYGRFYRPIKAENGNKNT